MILKIQIMKLFPEIRLSPIMHATITTCSLPLVVHLLSFALYIFNTNSFSDDVSPSKALSKTKWNEWCPILNIAA